MRRIAAALGAIGATGALALASPLAAPAAPGTFTFLGDGGMRRLTDPTRELAIPVAIRGFALNKTASEALLYARPDCTGRAFVLEPGGQMDGLPFRCVRFRA